MGWVPIDTRLPTAAEAAAGWRRVVAVARAQWPLLLLLLLGGGVFVLAAAGVAAVYDDVQDMDELAGLDQPVLDAAIDLRNPRLDAFITAYTDLGGVVWAPILTTIIIVALALLWRSWTPVILMVVAAAGSLTMTTVGKVVVGRERPDIGFAVPPFEDSPAFPSGHSLNAVVIAGILAYLVVLRTRSVRVAALAVVLAVLHGVLMGLSRVYLGLHWLTDVIVAWCLGAGWLALVVVVHQLILRRLAGRARRRDDAVRGT